jgi:hypothetical protein
MSGNGPKIFIAVLFLIGILFIVGINLGAAHSDDQTFNPPAWINGLGTAVARPQPLMLADLSPTPASCIQQGKLVVPLGKACTFAIHQSLFALRAVTLQLVQGASTTVTLTQEKALPIQQSLSQTHSTTDTEQMRVYPGKAHGMLVIECTDAGGASTCLLELK